MAKYELPQYQSMYRDPGSVQINQLKRQEFLSNMQADNALAMSVMNMDALDKDQERLTELADLYNNNIDNRAERKDYENLGMSIHKDAMQFTKDYTPIKRQVEIRAKAKASLDEAVKAKRISQDTANKLLAKSDYNYQGVKYTDAGTVDRDSFYKSPSFVDSIDVNELFQKEMKDKVERYAKQQGWSLADSEFNLVYDSEGRKSSQAGDSLWKITDGVNVETIPEFLVKAISDDVLNRPEVKASILQQADLETYRSGEVVQGQDNTQAETQISNTISTQKKKLKESQKDLKEKSLNDEEKTALKESITNLTNNIEYLENYLESDQDPVDLYRKLKFSEIASDHQDYWLQTYVYENKEIESDISLLSGDTTGGSKKVSHVQSYLQTSSELADVVSGGLSVESITRAAQQNQAVLQSTFDRFNGNEDESLNIPNINELLINANDEDDVKALVDKTGIGRGSIMGIIHNAKRADDNIRLLNRRLYEARAAVYGDVVNDDGTINEEKFNDHINHRYNNEIINFSNRNRPEDGGQYQYPEGAGALATISYPNITDAMKKIGLIGEDDDTKQALDVLMESEIIKGSRDGFGGDQVEYPQVGEAVMKAVLGEDFDDIPLVEIQKYIRDLTNYSRNQMELDSDSIEEHLNNNEIKVDYWLDTGFGDLTDETKTAFHDYFEKGLPNDQLVYTKSGEPITFMQYLKDKDYVSTDDGTMINRKDEKVDGINEVYDIDLEKTGLVTIANIDGEPMIAIAIMDKGAEGKQREEIDYIYIPANSLNVSKAGKSAMRETTNSIGFKLTRLYNNGLAHNVTSDTPPIFEGTVRFNYANPKLPIEIINENGKKTYHSKEDGLMIIESKIAKEGLQEYIY